MAKKGEKDKGAAKTKQSASKMVEDRTFGMKNKKGAQAQRQIQQMQKNLSASGSAEEKKKQAEKAQREREKKAAEDAKREADALLNRPAQIQKVPFGVDPKTVVCIFFKKGNCEKGKKCKFAHDLSLERKTEKRNLYTDTREEESEKKKQETSADWDEEQLRKVVLSKKGNQKTTTEKVCKYFIQAIEDGKYGWFWICPNGGDKCMYKHALPPGYVPSSLIEHLSQISHTDPSPASSSRPRSSGRLKRPSWTSPLSRRSLSRTSSSRRGTSSPARSRPSHQRALPSGRSSASARRRPRSRPARPRRRLVVTCLRAASGRTRMSRTMRMTTTSGTSRGCARRRRLSARGRRRSGWA